MVDCRELIIEDLELLRKKEQQERNIFKERAYDKVINGLRDYEKPIHKIEDINTIPGVGDSIRAKIKEVKFFPYINRTFTFCYIHTYAYIFDHYVRYIIRLLILEA
jgi:DNA polymerase/3'-5' exonuclease PolX